MSNPKPHTPTPLVPLYAEDCLVMLEGQQIATACSRPWAMEIVRAVNTHDALVAALQATSMYAHAMHPVDGRGRADFEACDVNYCREARAALALVQP